MWSARVEALGVIDSDRLERVSESRNNVNGTNEHEPVLVAITQSVSTSLRTLLHIHLFESLSTDDT
jgi:hypothetical protein